jgi:hypothetical protein
LARAWHEQILFSAKIAAASGANARADKKSARLSTGRKAWFPKSDAGGKTRIPTEGGCFGAGLLAFTPDCQDQPERRKPEFAETRPLSASPVGRWLIRARSRGAAIPLKGNLGAVRLADLMDAGPCQGFAGMSRVGRKCGASRAEKEGERRQNENASHETSPFTMSARLFIA